MLNMTINTVGTLNLSTEFGALFVFSAFIETLDFFFFKKCILRSPCYCVANSGHGFGLLQKWGEVKPVNAISTLSI
jgi:hypothetical protein